jgi:hypothetical protein
VKASVILNEGESYFIIVEWRSSLGSALGALLGPRGGIIRLDLLLCRREPNVSRLDTISHDEVALLLQLLELTLVPISELVNLILPELVILVLLEVRSLLLL